MDDEIEVETSAAMKMTWRQLMSLGMAMVSDYITVTGEGFKVLSAYLDADDDWHRERKDMENATREAIEEIVGSDNSEWGE